MVLFVLGLGLGLGFRRLLSRFSVLHFLLLPQDLLLLLVLLSHLLELLLVLLLQLLLPWLLWLLLLLWLLWLLALSISPLLLNPLLLLLLFLLQLLVFLILFLLQLLILLFVFLFELRTWRVRCARRRRTVRIGGMCVGWLIIWLGLIRIVTGRLII